MPVEGTVSDMKPAYTATTGAKKRYNTLRPSPPNAVFKLAVVQYKVGGHPNGGSDKGLADVPDEDYFDACELTDLMGVKAIEMLTKAKP